eukprot:781705_1
MGGFDFHTSNGQGQFCNILFETLDVAFSFYPSNGQHINVDNCEFSDINVVAESASSSYKSFTDCYFHDLTHVNDQGNMIIDNCLFERVTNGLMVRQAPRVQIYNSEIVGDGTQTCVYLYDPTNVIQNSIFTNCAIGLRTINSRATIQYNTFQNNSVGIYTECSSNGVSYQDTIQYNNFINNTINVQLAGSIDVEDGNYNYFGVSSSDQSVIGATIQHLCDGY